MKLEDLQLNVVVRGILPEALITVVSVQCYGDNTLELTNKIRPREHGDHTK